MAANGRIQLSTGSSLRDDRPSVLLCFVLITRQNFYPKKPWSKSIDDIVRQWAPPCLLLRVGRCSRFWLFAWLLVLPDLTRKLTIKIDVVLGNQPIIFKGQKKIIVRQFVFNDISMLPCQGDGKFRDPFKPSLFCLKIVIEWFGFIPDLQANTVG